MNKKKGIVKQYITNKLTHTKKLNNKNNTWKKIRVKVNHKVG
jgi:hypothetical protein